MESNPKSAKLAFVSSLSCEIFSTSPMFFFKSDSMRCSRSNAPISRGFPAVHVLDAVNAEGAAPCPTPKKRFTLPGCPVKTRYCSPSWARIRSKIFKPSCDSRNRCPLVFKYIAAWSFAGRIPPSRHRGQLMTIALPVFRPLCRALFRK